MQTFEAPDFWGYTKIKIARFLQVMNWNKLFFPLIVGVIYFPILVENAPVVLRECSQSNFTHMVTYFNNFPLYPFT